MVKIIEDEWQCKRCGHRMKEHIMHSEQCITCMGDCPAFLLTDKDAQTVRKLKNEYYVKKEPNIFKKLLMKMGLMK